MSGFSAEWLDLRERVDHASRSVSVMAELSAQLAVRSGKTERPLTVVDLACGTGSNPRHLLPRLGPRQAWTALDADSQLLAAWPVRMAAWASAHGMAFTETAQELTVSSASVDARLRTTESDIASFPIEAITEGPDLVTASALLDLVSDAWMARCVEACADVRASVLFVLSYDGRMALTPTHPDDGFLLECVNAHQRGDKGFGPALGPHATESAAALLARVGYVVRRGRSDWHVGPDAWRLQQELVRGWAHAAQEIAPSDEGRITAWLGDRLAACDARSLHVVVGHEDVAGWPRSQSSEHAGDE